MTIGKNIKEKERKVLPDYLVFRRYSERRKIRDRVRESLIQPKLVAGFRREMRVERQNQNVFIRPKQKYRGRCI